MAIRDFDPSKLINKGAPVKEVEAAPKVIQKTQSKKVLITLPTKFIDLIDGFIIDSSYRDRSNYICRAIEDKLREDGLIKD